MDNNNNTQPKPPAQDPDKPLGDRGLDKTWEPPAGEQGISNRANDESEPDANDSSDTTNGHTKVDDTAKGKP